MALDLQSIYGWLYSRLATDSAGAAVRAVATVIPAHDLDNDHLPARPFLAFRQGAVGGTSDEMRTPSATWWVYDDVAQGTWRMNGLTAAVEQAYPYLAYEEGELTTSIGQPVPDTTLNLTGCPVTLLLYRR